MNYWNTTNWREKYSTRIQTKTSNRNHRVDAVGQIANPVKSASCLRQWHTKACSFMLFKASRAGTISQQTNNYNQPKTCDLIETFDCHSTIAITQPVKMAVITEATNILVTRILINSRTFRGNFKTRNAGFQDILVLEPDNRKLIKGVHQ